MIEEDILEAVEGSETDSDASYEVRTTRSVF